MAKAAAAAPGLEEARDRHPTEPREGGYDVDGWSPPSDGHEEDDAGSGGFAAQATALDVLLLRHAVQVLERRRSAASSSLFRRPG
ncbi:hypothetical protein THAOC_21407 [Thalassiosira oceanica]|uniref:Uncharacterized protein n=1 Tax=Thalassiosira oceanica TaxID=159749 RepID=K0S134_THAOC|nr:hypothetical protein THAOC_21407 [Thalassiosira oceanica]|eukprot:EJK58464.1 hypothetical protein THAOC_21407 [Thalassiosira oceanica]